MLKLIRLEWKKNNIGKYIISAVVLAAVLCVFMFALAFMGIANDAGTNVLDAAPGMDGISTSIELFTSMTYLVFTSVMLSVYVVSAYKNKTMNLMFSYPIKRQKIQVSQMLAVWIFCYAACVFTKLIVYGSITIGAQFMNSSFRLDFNMAGISFYTALLVKSVPIITMSFVALFIGMKMKSSKATIISSFFLIFLTQANVGDFTMRNSAVLPIALTAISFAFACLSVCGAEKRDVTI